MDSYSTSPVHRHLVRDALRRYAALLVLTGLVFGAAGYFVGKKQPDAYTAVARVLLRPTVGNALSPTSATSGPQVTVAMTTEAAVVTAPSVAASVAKQLSTDLPTVTSSVVSSVPSNTQIVEIDYTAVSPDIAQKGAQGLADSFLAYRKALSTAVVQSQLANLTETQKQVTDALKVAGDAAAVASAKPDANAQVQLYAGRLATVQNSIATTTATDINPGSVVTPAVLPVDNSNIIKGFIAPAAFVIGLFLAMLVALWLVRRDDRIRNADEEDFSGAAVLTTLSGKAATDRLVTQGADDAVSESYRHARAGILAARGNRGTTFAVVGTEQGVQVGDVALNLGVSLARAGYRVAVADLTAGWEDLPAVVGVHPESGFSELLMSATAAPTSVMTRGVDVIGSGADPIESRDLFHGNEMAHAVKRIGAAHDFAVLAGAGVTTAEGSGVVLVADSVILVVESRRTTHGMLAQSLQRCHELGTPVLGVIVVPATTVVDRPLAATSGSRRRGQEPEPQQAAPTERVESTPHV